jgi:hypothetical protein
VSQFVIVAEYGSRGPRLYTTTIFADPQKAREWLTLGTPGGIFHIQELLPDGKTTTEWATRDIDRNGKVVRQVQHHLRFTAVAEANGINEAIRTNVRPIASDYDRLDRSEPVYREVTELPDGRMVVGLWTVDPEYVVRSEQ